MTDTELSYVYTLRAGRAASWETADVLTTGPVAVAVAGIRTLKTAPPTIIDAPGVGKAILPFSALVVYRAGASGYTTSGHLMLTTLALIAASPDFTNSLLEVKDFGETLGTDDLAFSMNNTSNSDIAGPGAAFTAVTIADVENEAVVLYCTGSDPTVGDGTLTIQVWYTIAEIV